MHELLDTSSTTVGVQPVNAIWNAVLPSPGELRSARRRLHLKAITILAMLVASYYALVISEFALVIRTGAAAVLALALIAVGTSIMHDANHGSFSVTGGSTRRSPTRPTRSAPAPGCGGSNTTCCTTATPTSSASTPISNWHRGRGWRPSQRWHRRFRWQHIYIWPLYGFLSIKNLLVSDVATLIRRQIGNQPLRQPVNLAPGARCPARQAGTSGLGGGRPAHVQPVVGGGRLLRRLLVVCRVRARRHLPAGALRRHRRAA